ncbi:MAG: hypothetical protein JWO79_1207, partial [Actinomycetia bacterium]|nr:hypothetical protein [Actinomycetes bacterium]
MLEPRPIRLAPVDTEPHAGAVTGPSSAAGAPSYESPASPGLVRPGWRRRHLLVVTATGLSLLAGTALFLQFVDRHDVTWQGITTAVLAASSVVAFWFADQLATGAVPRRRVLARTRWALVVGVFGTTATAVASLFVDGLWLEYGAWWLWLLVPAVYPLIAGALVAGRIRLVSLCLIGALALACGLRIGSVIATLNPDPPANTAASAT